MKYCLSVWFVGESFHLNLYTSGIIGFTISAQRTREQTLLQSVDKEGFRNSIRGSAPRLHVALTTRSAPLKSNGRRGWSCRWNLLKIWSWGSCYLHMLKQFGVALKNTKICMIFYFVRIWFCLETGGRLLLSYFEVKIIKNSEIIDFQNESNTICVCVKRMVRYLWHNVPIHS